MNVHQWILFKYFVDIQINSVSSVKFLLKILLFQQLTKVGLPMSVMSGMNPLSNGIINPAGKFAHQ